MPYHSRWRLVTSAESEAAALAAAASFVAGLLAGEELSPVAAPYFRGGFQVELEIAHGNEREAAEEWVMERVERLTTSWARTEDAGANLHLWSHELNIPRLEALEVRLVRWAKAERPAVDPEGELSTGRGPGRARGRSSGP